MPNFFRNDVMAALDAATGETFLRRFVCGSPVGEQPFELKIRYPLGVCSVSRLCRRFVENIETAQSYYISQEKMMQSASLK